MFECVIPVAAFVVLAPEIGVKDLDFQRRIEIDCKRADADARSVPGVISTDTPVDRIDERGYPYQEILSHDRSSIDLSRAPLPLIESHDNSVVNIGVVENLKSDGSKLRGTIRFGRTKRAKEIFRDVQDRILRYLSVGYAVDELDDPLADVRTATKWTPYEASIVAAPADPNAQFFRSSQKMSTENETKSPTTSRRKRAKQRKAEIAERERIQCITEAGKRHDREDLAEKHIRAGSTFEQFGAEVLDSLPGAQPSPRIWSPNTYDSAIWGRKQDSSVPGIGRSELEGYSLVKAIRATTDPKAVREAGFEIEVSQALSRHLRRSTQGLLIPLEALSTRIVQKGGSGSNLIPEEFLASEFIDVLRAKSAVMSQNVRILSGLQGDVVIPRKTASASVGWIAGDGADSLTPSDPTFDQVTLSPKTVGGLTTISHRMLHQSSPGIEQLVREDLAATIATEIDSAAINADGTGNQPVGILNTSGITALTYPNATLPGFTDIVALESNLDADNAAQGSLSYILTPSLKGSLKTTDKGTDTGQYVFEQVADGGRMNGYPALASSSVPAGHILFANWQDFLVGMWGVLEILSDPYGSNFASGSVSVRALLDIDFGVRHPESFAELHEAP